LQITRSININTASSEELKSIPNIGDKRAEKLLNLQKESRALTVEDVKMLTRIPSTIWDPLVKQEIINFEVPHMEPSVKQLTNEVKELRKLYHTEKQENE
jgi:predicted DNA-binding helix-hairpin-helix protein